MMDNRLPEVIPYRSFRDGTTDLRGNGLMVGYELVGPSPETHSEAQIFAQAEQFASALRHLGTGDALHMVTHRVPAQAPEPATFASLAARLVDDERRAAFAAEGHWLTLSRLYLSHRFEKPAKSMFQSILLSASGPQRMERHELLRNHALARFTAFEDAAASGLRLRKLTDAEMFADLIFTVLGHEHQVLLPDASVRLNEVIGAEHFVGGQAPQIAGWHLRPVCITAYPSSTAPQMLAVLLKRPGRMTISARFRCYDGYDQQAMLKTERQHWHKEILGGLWKVFKQWIGHNATKDADSAAQLANIDAAIAACSAGLTFGHATVTALVRDRDPERADMRAHDLVKDCHSHGMQARVETINAVEAIMGCWPGDTEHNIRRPIITGNNFADLTIPVTRWLGL